MPTLRYTGTRTGKEAVSTKYGLLRAGDVVEVPDDVAGRWLTKLPTAGGEASDFELAGAAPEAGAPLEEAQAPSVDAFLANTGLSPLFPRAEPLIETTDTGSEAEPGPEPGTDAGGEETT